jgi:hypothetical protein
LYPVYCLKVLEAPGIIEQIWILVVLFCIFIVAILKRILCYACSTLRLAVVCPRIVEADIMLPAALALVAYVVSFAVRDSGSARCRSMRAVHARLSELYVCRRERETKLKNRLFFYPFRTTVKVWQAR